MSQIPCPIGSYTINFKVSVHFERLGNSMPIYGFDLCAMGKPVDLGFCFGNVVQDPLNMRTEKYQKPKSGLSLIKFTYVAYNETKEDI